MRLWRPLHATALAVLVVGATIAPGVGAQPAATLPAEAPAAPVQPAGSSPVESSDIPGYRPSPARFAVAKFENRSGVRAFDWLVAGAPFEIAEKTEDIYGLEPTGGALHVTGDAVPAEIGAVVAFATKRAARWVITGWVERPNWQLQLGITIWSVVGPTAVIVATTERTGDVKAYHQVLGEALGDAWSQAGHALDPAKSARLARALATDLYSVNLMGRGLGNLTGALGPVSLKPAVHDLERAVFIDPKNYEAQRLVGEAYYLQLAIDPKADPKLAGRADGKQAYANDLAPDDIASLRGAARAATRGAKHEVARALWTKVVTRKPWDLDARYQLGAALWELGDATDAEKQLVQVTAKEPDHLRARRVLALIFASRGDTSRLVTELEAIAARVPDDLAVKADLATAYGAVGKWAKSAAALEQIVVVRPLDMPLHMRIGDAHVKLKDVDGALAWFARAARLTPDSSFPSFVAAQTLWDAGRLDEAHRAYTNAQKFKGDLAAAEQALGAIAMKQGRTDEAAWYLRRAVRGNPRVILAWRTLVAAELGRKDLAGAFTALERALATWPTDGQLLYLAGVAQATSGEKPLARERLAQAIAAAPYFAPAKQALAILDAGGAVTLAYPPELVRPWGDAAAITETVERYHVIQTTLATVRASYQLQVMTILGALGKGPFAPVKRPAVRRCPLVQIAPRWAAAQADLRRYERLGADLEHAQKYIVRHDDRGATGGLLPGARAQTVAARTSFKTALADISELRAQWSRGLGPELKVAGCSDKLLAAAVVDPERYRVVEDDVAPEAPVQQPPRPRARATFYVDNTRCPDPVDVWIDGTHLGQIPSGRRSALVTDGGERALCLILPGGAQCGERGTVRQVYLHDGWSTTLYCPM